jgi:hypothetical protein
LVINFQSLSALGRLPSGRERLQNHDPDIPWQDFGQFRTPFRYAEPRISTATHRDDRLLPAIHFSLKNDPVVVSSGT